MRQARLNCTVEIVLAVGQQRVVLIHVNARAALLIWARGLHLSRSACADTRQRENQNQEGRFAPTGKPLIHELLIVSKHR